MLGEGGRAAVVLEAVMKEKNTFSRLRAMNVLDHMNETARVSVSRIAELGDSEKIGAYGENYIGNVIKKAASDLGIPTPGSKDKPSRQKQRREGRGKGKSKGAKAQPKGAKAQPKGGVGHNPGPEESYGIFFAG